MTEILVNYWAILACGVANMVIGFLWYGPLLGKQWAVEMGWGSMTREQVEEKKKQAMPAYFQSFVGALIMAYVFNVVLQTFETETVGLALQGAFWMWLGFVVPVKYGDKLWSGKSLKLFFIDSFYYLAALMAMAVILVLWR